MTRIEADLQAEINAWTDARIRWIETRQGPASLEVGPDKPLGSLGIAIPHPKLLAPFGRALLRAPFRVHTAIFAMEGLERRWLSRQFSELDMAWVYAWRGPALRGVLRRHARVLKTSGLSTDPKEFVPRHRVVRAPVQTPLYDAIADAYGDTTNPGRTDVLPGIDRRALCRALRARGFMDPSIAFLPSEWWRDGDESNKERACHGHLLPSRP